MVIVVTVVIVMVLTSYPLIQFKQITLGSRNTSFCSRYVSTDDDSILFFDANDDNDGNCFKQFLNALIDRYVYDLPLKRSTEVAILLGQATDPSSTNEFTIHDLRFRI